MAFNLSSASCFISKAYIVASFRVRKSISLLNANIMKLQYDIFEEIGIQNSLVTVISLEPLVGLNWTNVVFGIWPYPINTAISSTGLSIIRDNFMTFVIGRSSLHLTTSLFGKTYFFQVLKFPGGITITPEQRAFLLQKAGALFNFTLNFSIEKVQENLAELKAQMKSGLLLNPYENLYVSLTNIKGSTVAPPTVVQASVVLAVGNRPPSEPRLRQLAQTIRSDGNHGNLGLNHTVFGRVKQIQLSSSLKHSLNGGGNGISIPPSPAPQPQVTITTIITLTPIVITTITLIWIWLLHLLLSTCTNLQPHVGATLHFQTNPSATLT